MKPFIGFLAVLLVCATLSSAEEEDKKPSKGKTIGCKGETSKTVMVDAGAKFNIRLAKKNYNNAKCNIKFEMKTCAEMMISCKKFNMKKTKKCNAKADSLTIKDGKKKAKSFCSKKGPKKVKVTNKVVELKIKTGKKGKGVGFQCMARCSKKAKQAPCPLKVESSSNSFFNSLNACKKRCDEQGSLLCKGWFSWVHEDCYLLAKEDITMAIPAPKDECVKSRLETYPMACKDFSCGEKPMYEDKYASSLAICVMMASYEKKTVERVAWNPTDMSCQFFETCKDAVDKEGVWSAIPGFCAPPSPPAPPPSPPTPPTTCPSTEISSDAVVGGMADCEANCDDDENCTGWTFLDGSILDKCYLYKGDAPEPYDDCAMSVDVTYPITCKGRACDDTPAGPSGLYTSSLDMCVLKGSTYTDKTIIRVNWDSKTKKCDLFDSCEDTMEGETLFSSITGYCKA